jgi:hypothetical protein
MHKIEAVLGWSVAIILAVTCIGLFHLVLGAFGQMLVNM